MSKIGSRWWKKCILFFRFGGECGVFREDCWALAVQGAGIGRDLLISGRDSRHPALPFFQPWKQANSRTEYVSLLHSGDDETIFSMVSF